MMYRLEYGDRIKTGMNDLTAIAPDIKYLMAYIWGVYYEKDIAYAHIIEEGVGILFVWDGEAWQPYEDD